MSLAKPRIPSRSVAFTARQSIFSPVFDTVSLAIPALPGAHVMRVTFCDWASFQASACSRPPPPMSKICITTYKFAFFFKKTEKSNNCEPDLGKVLN